jgi:hypothetical protein
VFNTSGEALAFIATYLIALAPGRGDADNVVAIVDVVTVGVPAVSVVPEVVARGTV